MAGSLLRSFVGGTRQMLSVQLFLSIGAVALAGWTLGVTNDLIRERERLQGRVVQLEQRLAELGEISPEPEAIVDASSSPGPYPGSVEGAEEPTPTEETPTDAADATPAPDDAKPDDTGQDAREPTTPPTRAENRDLGDIIGSLFAPPPPISTVVIHVRSETDRPAADRMAIALRRSAEVRTVVRVMPPRDPSQPGYAYFDGRQSAAAAEIVNQFHNIAREERIAVWAAQLRGVALPAQGEYSADRLDIVLPALPAERPALRDLQRAPVAVPERVN